MKLKLLSIYLFSLFILTTCTNQSGNVGPAPTPPSIVNTGNGPYLTSVNYPNNPHEIAISKSDPTFEHDNLGKISKIGGSKVNYINESLIELDGTGQIGDPILESKTWIHIQNSKVSYIVNRTIYTNNTIDRDSIVFSYENEFISTISTYRDGINSNGNWQLTLFRKDEYKIENGNITQVKKIMVSYGGYTVTRNYTYDDSSYMYLGEFAYEMPFGDYSTIYFLLHDKLGKKSKNNIITIKSVYDKIPFEVSFENISFTRAKDNQGRLSTIYMTGNLISSNPAATDIKMDFKDQAITLNY